MPTQDTGKPCKMSQTINQLTIINLGGPRTTEEIEPFLRDLFLDPYVFDLPLWEPLRKKLARFIAKKRAPKVAGTYASMGYGGGSPLFAETTKQADALKVLLEKTTGETWNTRLVMTCGYPNIRDLGSDLLPSEKNIFLPLYPQFSRSTTLSTGKIMEELTGSCTLGMRGWVDHFSSDPRFHKTVANLILDYFRGNLEPSDFIHLDGGGQSVPNWEEIDLVFSAHGIPMRLVKKGDVYVQEIESSVAGVEKELRAQGFRGEVHISFQSRVGPAKWTEPNTIQKLQELGSEKKNIAVYPISFVGDHLETLEEIGEELREVALESGAGSYRRIPAPGIYPDFIRFLHDLVLESALPSKEKTECLCLRYGGEKPGCV